MTRRMLVAAALIAAPALAQPVAPPTSEATATPAPDPVRLALARKLIDKVVPAGTMQRMMETSLGNLTGNVLSSFMPTEMRADLRSKDPAFDERMRRIMAVMAKEMGTVMNEMEPQMRAAVAVAYARRFDERQLNDIAAFFETPSGAAYARQSLTIMTDPDMMQVSMSMLPKFIARMGDIDAKIKAATADLPPPPKPAAKP